MAKKRNRATRPPTSPPAPSRKPDTAEELATSEVRLAELSTSFDFLKQTNERLTDEMKIVRDRLTKVVTLAGVAVSVLIAIALHFYNLAAKPEPDSLSLRELRVGKLVAEEVASLRIAVRNGADPRRGEFLIREGFPVLEFYSSTSTTPRLQLGLSPWEFTKEDPFVLLQGGQNLGRQNGLSLTVSPEFGDGQKVKREFGARISCFQGAPHGNQLLSTYRRSELSFTPSSGASLRLYGEQIAFDVQPPLGAQVSVDGEEGGLFDLRFGLGVTKNSPSGLSISGIPHGSSYRPSATWFEVDSRLGRLVFPDSANDKE